MLDTRIHVHALPRHATPRTFAGSPLLSTGWHTRLSLGEALDLSDAQMAELCETLKAAPPRR